MKDLDAVNPLAWSPDAAARRLGVSQRQIYNLMALGELQSMKSGKRRLIPDDELKAYLRRQLAASNTMHPLAKPKPVIAKRTALWRP